MRAINNSIIDRSYKNGTACERVSTKLISKPFNVISDCIVEMYDNDSKCTPSQEKTLKAYRSIFTDVATYRFGINGGIIVTNSSHKYVVGRGGGVICIAIIVDGEWKYIG